MTKILIIDDNVNLTTLLSKALAKFGYEPYVENHSLLALGTVREVLPDLILLDVMMPERDGGRVLADLRADLQVRYIPVILLTALAREAQTLGEMDGITSTVIGKPVELKQLITEIETQLDNARTYNEQMAAQRCAMQRQPHARQAALPGCPPPLQPQSQSHHLDTTPPNLQAGPPPPPKGSGGHFSFFGQVPPPPSPEEEADGEPIPAERRWDRTS